jgi:cardiolipin synthase
VSSTTWQLLVGLLHVLLAAGVSSHVVLTKHDVRSAIGWVGLVWLTPVLGSILYFFLGINRIRRAAGRMRLARDSHTAERRIVRASTERHDAALVPPGYRGLANLGGRVTWEPLVEGNHVEPLRDGDEAYPAILEAIRGARHTIGFATYIFDHGRVGLEFAEALAAAVQRGVTVRVLIDSVGSRYSRPSIVGVLRARGIRVALFLPSPFPFSHPYFNMRNHRKLLVVDGTVGFTGGINIRDGCVLASHPVHPTRDVHFRVRGPVVRHLVEAFLFDWRYTTRESLDGPEWLGVINPAGDMVARGIADGPDETHDSLPLVLQGALATARESVRIVTPYFLPETSLLDSLRVAALRGVDVRVYVPEHGNLRLVHWAMRAQFARIIQGGVQVALTRAPFDHSKLMVVDEAWSLVGSANWDPRSLRLNFEYVLECWSEPLARQLLQLIEEKAVGARTLTRADMEAQPLSHRLRDGVAWLAQPYL